MKGRLLNLLAGVSVLWCIATAALWVRTYWRCDEVTIRARCGVTTFPSAIEFCTASYGYWTGASLFQSFPVKRNEEFDEFFRFTTVHRNAGIYIRCLGVAFSSVLQPMPLPPCRFHRLQIPLLFPMILGSVCPILWLRNRKNPAKNGACPVCGYDLRATPDRCPECGAIPPKRA